MENDSCRLTIDTAWSGVSGKHSTTLNLNSRVPFCDNEQQTVSQAVYTLDADDSNEDVELRATEECRK